MRNNYFIGIGAQKSGTTWLGDYLNNHPDICFSPIKELHIFDVLCGKQKYFYDVSFDRLNDEIKLTTKEKYNSSRYLKLLSHLYRIEIVNNIHKYHEYFNILNPDNKICGEITPEYSLLDNGGFNYMKEILGNNLKIIFIMRNPIDRHWSQLRFNKTKLQYPTLKDPISSFNESFDIKDVYNRSNYCKTLINLNKSFKSRNILILFYENLINPELNKSEINKICDFLNIKYISANLDRYFNVSDKIELNIELKKYGIYKLKNIYKYIFNNFDNVPENWYNDFNLIY